MPPFQPTKTHRNLPDLDEHVVLGTLDVFHAVRQKALRDRSNKERGGADPDDHHDDRDARALGALRSDVAIADRLVIVVMAQYTPLPNEMPSSAAKPPPPAMTVSRASPAVAFAPSSENATRASGASRKSLKSRRKRSSRTLCTALTRNGGVSRRLPGPADATSSTCADPTR